MWNKYIIYENPQSEGWGIFVAFHSKCSEEFSRIFISEVETVLDPRYQTAESARIFISVVETVLATRNQTAESAKFFFFGVETVLATQYLTTESARFFISWDVFFLRN